MPSTGDTAARRGGADPLSLCGRDHRTLSIRGFAAAENEKEKGPTAKDCGGDHDTEKEKAKDTGPTRKGNCQQEQDSTSTGTRELS